ncbi:hypothetical protein BaRGS_00001000 [Batillaria attramentaria]|uniref:rRNA methyltransferase 1, mitochondrial n=1 Tax=Batillaria attramentaria TaxID=370345 RepID=A0ABD0M931_9CAEN
MRAHTRLRHLMCAFCAYRLRNTFGKVTHVPKIAFSVDAPSRPKYNYGLPGKGKSKIKERMWKRQLADSDTHGIQLQGEVLFGIHPVLLALGSTRRQHLYNLYLEDKQRQGKLEGMFSTIATLAQKRNVDIQYVPKKTLTYLSGNRPHQGVCLDTSSLILPDLDPQELTHRCACAVMVHSHCWTDTWTLFLLEVHMTEVHSHPLEYKLHHLTFSDSQGTLKMAHMLVFLLPFLLVLENVQEEDWNALWLLLYNVQDPMNFGAILRSAYFLGVDRVIVPELNSCAVSPVVSKASAGALEVIDLCRLPGNYRSILQLTKAWQSAGGITVGTASNTDGAKTISNLQDFQMTTPTMVIVGNEGSGVDVDILDLCDTLLTITPLTEDTPQLGVESLNVSVATGILIHWLQASRVKQ